MNEAAGGFAPLAANSLQNAFCGGLNQGSMRRRPLIS
jgi:hypothetical protein